MIGRMTSDDTHTLPETDWDADQVGGFIHELIEGRQFGRLKEALTGMEIHDLADLLVNQETDDLTIAFRILPTDTAAEIFGYFSAEQQQWLLTGMSRQRVAELLNEMPPDDRTELLEEVPGELAQKLIAHLTGEERTIANDLLDYPLDSIGRLMTPEYVAVRKDWSIEHVLRHLRKIAAEQETYMVIYVVDDRWKLLDEISLEDIVLAEPEQIVEELMDEQVASLNANDDQETAVELFRKYDAVALPVVDNRGTLVGIVTFDDVMDIQQEETTEDMQKMAAIGTIENGYFSVSTPKMLRKRLPWLAMLLVAETAAVFVLKGFEQWLAVLAMFMPLINATAGNTGSQVAMLMIRGFAISEIDSGDWWKVLFREMFRGVTMGVLLGCIAGGIVLAVGVNPRAGLAITPRDAAFAAGVAMLAAVTLANLIGAMLPFLFKRIGVDPAVTSGPFISVMMDVSSILIFFSIASTILHLVG